MPHTEKATNLRQAVAPRPFKLTSVEKADVPHGGGTQQWYSYVLDNGRSQIRGKQSGSLKAVTAYATQYADELNARVLAGQSTWSPRGRKPAAAKAAAAAVAE
jgi:hypothetical protein